MAAFGESCPRRGHAWSSLFDPKLPKRGLRVTVFVVADNAAIPILWSILSTAVKRQNRFSDLFLLLRTAIRFFIGKIFSVVA